jgi:hypothetical protein
MQNETTTRANRRSAELVQVLEKSLEIDFCFCQLTFYNFSILPPQSLAWLQKGRQGQASNLQDNGGHAGRDATGKVTRKKEHDINYFLVLKIEITNILKKFSSVQGCPVNLK